MNNPVIEVKDFRKTYGTFTAVDGINFEVQAGGDFRLAGSKRRRQDQYPRMPGGSAKSQQWFLKGEWDRSSPGCPQTQIPNRRPAPILRFTRKHNP